jgi:hypothetical protein
MNKITRCLLRVTSLGGNSPNCRTRTRRKLGLLCGMSLGGGTVAYLAPDEKYVSFVGGIPRFFR